MTSLLILTNQAPSSDPAAQVARPYRAALGSADEVEVVSHAASDKQRHLKILSAIRRTSPDLVLVASAKSYPSSRVEAEELTGALRAVPVAYHDGDAYGGRGKPVPSPVRFWVSRANRSFSAAGGRHLHILAAGEHRPVNYVPTVAPLEFARSSDSSPGPDDASGITMLANTTARQLPGYGRPIPLTGIPGETGRFEVVRRLRDTVGVRFDLWGSGWPKGWSRGAVPFSEQLRRLRAYRVSVCWDHYPDYPGCYSNRLPIAMLSGRHVVTTDHGGMDWLRALPSVHLARKPRFAAETGVALVQDVGLEGPVAVTRKFVLDHLTEVHLARYILSHFALANAPEGPPWQAARTLTEEAWRRRL